MLQVTDAESPKNTDVIFKKKKCKEFLKAILSLQKYLKHKFQRSEGKVNYLGKE